MKGSILIADDQDFLLKLATRLLESIEHPIETFVDPFLALQRLQDSTKERVVLVITDFDFGQKINGVDIAKVARESGVGPVLLHSSSLGAIPNADKLQEEGIVIVMKELNAQFPTLVKSLLQNPFI